MPLRDKNNIKQKRAINFDLSIKKLMTFYSKTNPKGAYKDIYNYFVQNGFELSEKDSSKQSIVHHRENER